MENQKLLKKFNTSFWFVLGVLPLLYLLISFIGYLFIFKGTGILPEQDVFSTLITTSNTIFYEFLLTFIYDALHNVFDLLSFNIGDLGLFIIILLTWFLQVMLLHVIVDVLSFVFKIYHKLIDKVV